VIDKDFTDVYSAQLGRIRTGMGSAPHHDPYNHAFYFVRGTGKVRVGNDEWDL
jgi:quercetin dioxygenase-like cupin family protein